MTVDTSSVLLRSDRGASQPSPVAAVRGPLRSPMPGCIIWRMAATQQTLLQQPRALQPIAHIAKHPPNSSSGLGHQRRSQRLGPCSNSFKFTAHSLSATRTSRFEPTIAGYCTHAESTTWCRRRTCSGSLDAALVTLSSCSALAHPQTPRTGTASEQGHEPLRQTSMHFAPHWRRHQSSTRSLRLFTHVLSR